MIFLTDKTEGWMRYCMGQDGTEYAEFEVSDKFIVRKKWCPRGALRKEGELTYGEFKQITEGDNSRTTTKEI